MKVVSCRPAWAPTSNRFTTLFAEAVQRSGWNVREFSWGWSGLLAPKAILLHWPDDMFTAQNWFQHMKALGKLALLRTAKVFGAKLIWMVHEAHPHDLRRRARWSTRAFLSSLDGAIYLSDSSRRVSVRDLPALGHVPALITRHGHYRDDLEFDPQPRPAAHKPLKLVYFGQIRRYKNLDRLIEAARGIDPSELQITIIGWSKEPAFTKELEALAASVPAITLDIRDKLAPQADLEHLIAESDGVVLPYRKILNSGAALFALSCNRPVLAPRLGSLPELQDEIGADWVSLYTGDINERALRQFGDHLRSRSGGVADMSLYEWPAIGESIGQFLDDLTTHHAGARTQESKSGVHGT